MCLARLSSLDSLERFFGRSGEFGTFLPMTSVDMPFGSSRRSRSAATTTTPLQPARITLRRLRIGECCRSPLLYLYRIPALYPEKTSISECLVESKWTFRICSVVSFVLGGCWGVCGEGGGLSIFWEAGICIELFKCNQSTSKQGRDKTRAVKRKPCTNL